MTLKVGIHTLMRGPMASREGTMSVAKSAESLGFSHIGINDHVVVPTDIASKYPYTEHGQWPGRAFGECLEMLTTMSFVAGCTERIKILSSVMILPYRPAVLTAKMLSTADLLSNGRIIVGCGVGWMPEEFEALAAPPFAARGGVTDEWLDAFRELWTKDAPAYSGEHVAFSNITFMPKPVQPAGMPVWIGGESTIALKRTVRAGHCWYPASNNPQRPLKTAPPLRTMVDELHRISEAAGRDPASIEVALVYLTSVEWSSDKGGEPRMFKGSSADMAADLRALEQAGAQHVSLIFQAATASETIERMQRFAEEVMPLV